ncbi:MAG: biosis protein MshJ [Burkholderiales bacterium]|jgi:MSHA biogenesis protein MshJ
MNAYWQKFVLRIDALSLRERLIIFVMAALVVITLVNSLLLESQFTKQKQISQRIRQEQSQIAGLQAEIQQILKSHDADPDRDNRERLVQLTQQSRQIQGSLRDMQKGLIAPDKITVVLEDILRRNGRLRLVSLKTLPVADLTEHAGEENKSAEKLADAGAVNAGPSTNGQIQKKPAAEAIYKHGVEITVQGGYPDIVNYLAALESMPWQLFWGGANLTVEEYPRTTLTLTLYTLSLDRKWLNL